MGLTGAMRGFLETSTISKWIISVGLEKTRATTSARETSFDLGRQTWHIISDSPECKDGEHNGYTRQLKMPGCNSAGEFTCDDGQCVTMEQRCDQIAD